MWDMGRVILTLLVCLKTARLLRQLAQRSLPFKVIGAQQSRAFKCQVAEDLLLKWVIQVLRALLAPAHLTACEVKCGRRSALSWSRK